MPPALDHWLARSLIVLGLALAYLWLVIHSIGWVARLGWSYQDQPLWWVYSQMSLTHLLAVLIAAVPVAMAVVLLIKKRPVRHALVIAVPVAASLFYDVFIGYPTELVGPRSTVHTVLAMLSIAKLQFMPALLVWVIRRLRPEKPYTLVRS